MKIKLTAALAGVLAATALNAAASGLGIEYDFKNDKMIISGNADAGAEVSLILQNTDTGTPYLITQGKCSAGGKYEFSVDLGILEDGTYSAQTYYGNETESAEKYYSASLKPPKDTGNNNNGGGNKGGGGSGGGTSFSPVVDTSNVPQPGKAAAVEDFSDVPASHWAYNSVMKLAGKGIVSGVGDNLYGINDNLTREQFAKLLIDTLKLDLVEDDIEHSDVDKNSWSYPYLVAIYKYGIMEGYDDITLGPKDNITRQDLAVLAARALEVKSISPAQAAREDFADAQEISDYAKDSVSLLYGAGIISGMEDSQFSPKSYVTRAQAAVILDKMLSLIGG